MAYKMVNTGICTIMRIYLLQIMEGVPGITGQVDTIRSALLPFNTYMPGLCVLDCAQASLCEYCGIGVFEDDPYLFCRPSQTNWICLTCHALAHWTAISFSKL